MTGHGHVTPNPDGLRARCGGPALCKTCQREAGQLHGAALGEFITRFNYEATTRHSESLSQFIDRIGDEVEAAPSEPGGEA